MSFLLTLPIPYLLSIFYVVKGLPWWLSRKTFTCNAEDHLQGRRCGFHPCIEKIPWRRKWQPIPIFLPGKSHGQRSLADCHLWDHKRVGRDLETKPPPKAAEIAQICVPLLSEDPQARSSSMSLRTEIRLHLWLSAVRGFMHSIVRAVLKADIVCFIDGKTDF